MSRETREAKIYYNTVRSLLRLLCLSVPICIPYIFPISQNQCSKLLPMFPPAGWPRGRSGAAARLCGGQRVAARWRLQIKRRISRGTKWVGVLFGWFGLGFFSCSVTTFRFTLKNLSLRPELLSQNLFKTGFRIRSS